MRAECYPTWLHSNRKNKKGLGRVLGFILVLLAFRGLVGFWAFLVGGV